MRISIDDIYLKYSDKPILDHISFNMNDNDKIGIIGVNGSGKSSLLKIIMGIETYQGSKIIKSSDIKIGYLSQDPIFNNELTIYEVIKNNNDKLEIYEIETMLNKFKLYNHKLLVKNCSGGELKRLALSLTLLSDCNVYILDEPTNHLDNDMIEYLEKFLIKSNKELIMITHDRYFLDRVVNKIVEIDNTKSYVYEGNYAKYLELKEIRLQTQSNYMRKRATILKREYEWIKAGVKARTTKSKSRIDAYYELKDNTININNDELKIDTISSRLGKKTIELYNISKSYNDRLLFNDFSYNFLHGDCIGIVGNNGTGKSTLLKIILNEISSDSGNIEYGETIKIGYFSQTNTFKDESMRVIDFIKSISDSIETSEGTMTASKMLELFLFDDNKQYIQIHRLSGGEKRRLFLLEVLMSNPNVLVFDEPTNDLDILTLSILEDYLLSFKGIVLAVSHDRFFLDRIANKIFAFENNTINIYPGNFNDYLNKKIIIKEDKEAKTNTRSNILKMTSKEKKELENIDNDIESIHNQISNIDIEMNNTTNFELINELSNKRSELESKLELLEERWIYLNELKEEIEALKTK